MKHIVMILVLTGMAYMAAACDICGCGAGNTYTGILPEFKRNIIGLRHRYNAIRTHLGPGGTATYLTSSEYYNTAEIWAGIRFNNRLRLVASIPCQFNQKINNSGTSSKQGLGDVTASAFYRLLNNVNGNGEKSFTNIVWAGAGIKLPTGKYKAQDKTASAANNLFQLGTGSIDFLFSAMYDINYHGWGMNVNAQYRINTPNRYHYAYGNKASISSQLYYRYKISNNLVISPNAGIFAERSNTDNDQQETVDISGGCVLMGGTGLETTFKKYAVGFSWQTPLRQDMAMGIIKAQQRTMLHFSILL